METLVFIGAAIGLMLGAVAALTEDSPAERLRGCVGWLLLGIVGIPFTVMVVVVLLGIEGR